MAYTWGANGLVSERFLTGTAYSLWYHFGPQGETRYLTNMPVPPNPAAIVDSYLYTAYGEPVASTGTDRNPFQYGGQVGYYTGPGAGIVLCGARWYNPYTARWMTRDPIGYVGGADLYAYCGESPVGGLDASGLDCGGRYWLGVESTPPPAGDGLSGWDLKAFLAEHPIRVSLNYSAAAFASFLGGVNGEAGIDFDLGTGRFAAYGQLGYALPSLAFGLGIGWGPGIGLSFGPPPRSGSVSDAATIMVGAGPGAAVQLTRGSGISGWGARPREWFRYVGGRMPGTRAGRARMGAPRISPRGGVFAIGGMIGPVEQWRTRQTPALW